MQAHYQAVLQPATAKAETGWSYEPDLRGMQVLDSTKLSFWGVALLLTGGGEGGRGRDELGEGIF